MADFRTIPEVCEEKTRMSYREFGLFFFKAQVIEAHRFKKKNFFLNKFEKRMLYEPLVDIPSRTINRLQRR